MPISAPSSSRHVAFCPKCKSRRALSGGKCFVCEAEIARPPAARGSAARDRVKQAASWVRQRPWVAAVPPWIAFAAFLLLSRTAWVTTGNHAAPAGFFFVMLLVPTAAFLGACYAPGYGVRARESSDSEDDGDEANLTLFVRIGAVVLLLVEYAMVAVLLR